MPDQTQFVSRAETPLDLDYENACAREGFVQRVERTWPISPTLRLADALSNVDAWLENEHVTTGLYSWWGYACARVTITRGMAIASASAANREEASVAMAEIERLLPRHEPTDPNTIPVSFWALGPHGPTMYRRELDADAWGSIEGNYPTGTRTPLARMVAADFKPGHGGQLILWHGEPGTGKTTALRSLAREWRDWCDFHYIVDPERFFGEDAMYMMHVMMGAEDMLFEDPASVEREPRWRLLILEDCGEMLTADAQTRVGQALSRLLNACDGMIGRGLRLMILLTTNEPVPTLHKAISRPGRCAANVTFDAMSATEARAWLRERGVEASDVGQVVLVLADLYAIVEEFEQTRGDRRVGFHA